MLPTSGENASAQAKSIESLNGSQNNEGKEKEEPYCNSRYEAYDAAEHHYGLTLASLGRDTDIEALNYGLSNFDDFFLALLTIFQCITMEGWTKIMNIYEDAASRLFVDLYYISCVVICSFFHCVVIKERKNKN